jgi:hypothetical protein
MLGSKVCPVSIRSRFNAWQCGASSLIAGSRNRCTLTRSLSDRYFIIRMDNQKCQYISESIRVIPDFPKPGIMFQDVTSLLLDPKVLGRNEGPPRLIYVSSSMYRIVFECSFGF